jgi:hypothetical protein
MMMVMVMLATFVVAVHPVVMFVPMAGDPDHFPVAFPVAFAVSVIRTIANFDPDFGRSGNIRQNRRQKSGVRSQRSEEDGRHGQMGRTLQCFNASNALQRDPVARILSEKRGYKGIRNIPPGSAGSSAPLANELLHFRAMNITLKTKIRCNGKEYSSVDELPPEIRAAYERAIAGGSKLAVSHSVTPRLVVNGQQFSSVADMSAAEKKLYDDAMQLILDGAITKATMATFASGAADAPVANAKPTTIDSGWLTKRQIQLIILVAGVLVALALIIGAWQ